MIPQGVRAEPGSNHPLKCPLSVWARRLYIFLNSDDSLGRKSNLEVEMTGRRWVESLEESMTLAMEQHRCPMRSQKTIDRPSADASPQILLVLHAINFAAREKRTTNKTLLETITSRTAIKTHTQPKTPCVFAFGLSSVSCFVCSVFLDPIEKARRRSGAREKKTTNKTLLRNTKGWTSIKSRQPKTQSVFVFDLAPVSFFDSFGLS